MTYRDLEKKRQYEREYYYRTRDKRLALQKKRYHNNPTSNIRSNRNASLKRTYGITLADYEEMFANQNGQCAICGQRETTRTLAVDHNHKTEQVRSLLCGNCNRGLGLFRDSSSLLKRAVQYLNRHGGSH